MTTDTSYTPVPMTDNPTYRWHLQRLLDTGVFDEVVAELIAARITRVKAIATAGDMSIPDAIALEQIAANT